MEAAVTRRELNSQYIHFTGFLFRQPPLFISDIELLLWFWRTTLVFFVWGCCLPSLPVGKACKIISTQLLFASACFMLRRDYFTGFANWPSLLFLIYICPNQWQWCAADCLALMYYIDKVCASSLMYCAVLLLIFAVVQFCFWTACFSCFMPNLPPNYP